MIKGIGVDICDLHRLGDLDKLALKILHKEEYLLYQQKRTEQTRKEFLGGRFAVKEAYIKACGITPFKEICCLNDADGKPYIVDKDCHVSISHEKDYAVAFLVAE